MYASADPVTIKHPQLDFLEEATYVKAATSKRGIFVCCASICSRLKIEQHAAHNHRMDKQQRQTRARSKRQSERADDEGFFNESKTVEAEGNVSLAVKNRALELSDSEYKPLLLQKDDHYSTVDMGEYINWRLLKIQAYSQKRIPTTACQLYSWSILALLSLTISSILALFGGGLMVAMVTIFTALATSSCNVYPSSRTRAKPGRIYIYTSACINHACAYRSSAHQHW